MRLRSQVVLSVAAALAGGALLPAGTAAAGRKSDGASVVIVDDLLGGAAASVKATGGGRELDGAISPVAAVIAGGLTPDTTAEAGYFSLLVSTPVNAQFLEVFVTSASVSWTNAAPPNPLGTLYRLELSTAPGFTGMIRSTETYDLTVVSTGLAQNTSYYARIKSSYSEGDDSFDFVFGSTRMPLNLPPGCGDGFSVKQDGSENFATISEALNALPATFSTTTCVVIRDTETYSEQVFVQGFANNGYRLIIMSDPSLVSGAPVVAPPMSSTAAFLIANSSVDIVGIGVVASQSVPYGVWASSSDVSLSSVSVSTSGNFGIYTAGVRISSWSSIRYSTVAVWNAHGIWIDGSMGTTVGFSTAVNNSAGSYAVYLGGGSNNALTMIFASNSHASGYGLYTLGSDTNTVTQSYLRGGFFGAILNAGSNDNAISLSTMIGNSSFGFGLAASASDSNTVTQSYLWGGQYGAVLDTGAAYNAISLSTLIGNASFGLYALGADSNTVTQSYLWGGSRGAFLGTGSDYNAISLSTMISDNAGNPALYISASSSNTITSSYVQGSTAALISGSTGTVISGSVFVATNMNGSALAFVGGSVDLTVTTSTFKGGLSGAGILLNDGNSGTVNLASNTVTGSARGLVIQPQAADFTMVVDSMTFRVLTPGATAVHFLGGSIVSTLTLANFEDSTISANISGAALALASRITMKANRGPRRGPSFENDPNALVDWEDMPPPGAPAIAVVSLSSMVVAYATTASEGYVVEASTAVDFTGIPTSSSTSNPAEAFLAPQNLAINTTYYVRVAALYGDGRVYDPTALATATLANEPAGAVSTFSAVANDAFVGAWDGAGNGAGTSYEAVVSTEQAFPNLNAGNVAVSTSPEGAPSAPFSGLSADTTYYLFARAVNHGGVATAFAALGSTVTLVNLPATAVTTFTAVTGASLTAQWDANGNGSGTLYSAAVSTSAPYPNDSAGNVVIATAPAGTPSADFTGLFGNATYYFAVAAINRAGSPTAYVALGSTVSALNDPVSGASTFTVVDAGLMSVAWGANNNIAGTLYEVTLSTDAAFPNAHAGNVTVSTQPQGPYDAVLNGLVGNTTYNLFVRAIGRDGVPSAYLSLGSTVTLAFEPATAATTFTVVDISSMSVAWSANGNAADVTTYTVVLTTGSSYPNAFAGNQSISTAPIGALPAATVSGLVGNTTYFLFVRAVNHGGVATSFAALGSTATLANEPATAATTFTAVDASSMSVAWSANGNPVAVTLYRVVLSTGASYPNSFAGNVLLSTAPGGALPTATVSGLLSNATYQLFIAAVNHGGVATSFAALGSTATLANEPATAATTFTAVDISSMSVAWSANGNVAGTLYEAAVSTENAFPNGDAGNVYVTTRPEGAASAVFAGLGVNATYYLFARAVSHSGLPTDYTALGATVTLADVPVSDASTFTAVGFSSAAAQWLAGGNPPGTEFQLAASTGLGLSGAVLFSGWSASVSTVVYGLSANATYYFGARARNWSGEPSAYLPLGSTVTLANPPAALAQGGVGPFSLPLVWSPAGNFSGGPDSWQAAAPLPSVLQGHALANSGGRLYVSGGSSGGGALTTVRFAPVAADGTVGSWTFTTSLPAARDSHAMAVWGGRLYVAGGFDGGSAQVTVWWAPILEDGALGPWRSAPSLPEARHKLTLTASGGALFAVGGDNGIVPQSAVYAAAIRSDGSLGPWSTTTVLPAARAGHGAAAALGRLYVSGGVGAGLESSVISAPLSGASAGAWTAAPALPAGRTRHAMAASPARLYVIGGHDGGSAQTTVWSAALSDVGDVGAWEVQAPLPSARYLHSLALLGERLAVVGGSNGAAAVDLVTIGRLTGSEYLAESANDASYSLNYSSSGWLRGTSFEFTGLTPNTTYYARVRGRSLSGVPTDVTALGSTITLAAVAQSAASTFTAVEISSIGVQWIAGANPAGTEFRAAASTAADFSGATIFGDWGTATTALFNSLALNTSYYFEASGRNAAGQEGSPLALGAAYTLASAPSGSVITAAQTTGFSLEWSANGNPAGTRFEAQAALLADFSTVIASSVTVSTAAAFAGLPSASTFYARVRALNGNGLGSSFDVAVSTLTGIDGAAPGVSTGAFAYQGASAGALYAAWVAPGDDGYAGDLAAGSTFYVQWSTSNPAAVGWSTASAQVVVSTGPVKLGASVSRLISGLPQEQIVHLRVWTSDDGGNYSAPSATFSAYASPFTLTRADGSADTGRSPSLAVDRFGDLHAAYRSAAGELRYAKRTVGLWGASSLIDVGSVGELAIAVDNDGNPQIFYRDAGVARLKIARFSGTWTVSIIENGSFRAGGLALDPDGRASISYYDAALGDLKFGRWTGSAWSTETVRSAGDVGRMSGLALDGAQNPHIAYGDDGATTLRFSSKTLASWSDIVVEAAVTAGSSPAVAVDANGLIFIAYAAAGAGSVKIASISVTGMSSVSTVEGPGFDAVGGAALDGAGRPLFVYRDSLLRDLKFARWTGTAFSTGTIDSYGDQGEGSALAIDGSGGVQVAYYDGLGGALKAASFPAAVIAAAGGGAGSRASAPYNVSGAAVSLTSIQWTWTDNATNELGYRLYGAEVSTGPYALIAGTATISALSGSGGAVSYTEAALTAGTTYYRYAVAVNAGGVAASKLADAYPFDTADLVAPVITNNQTGDLSWRRTNDRLYDVDFLDVGSSKLDRFSLKASTVPGGAGPDLVAFTDAVTAINAGTYLADWPLPAAVFTALREDATNYITVRAFDGAGNTTTLTDAFFVLKDTTPPSLVDNQAGDAVLRAASGTLYDADALDATSGLAAFQYSASLGAGAGDAALIAWTDIALPAGATSYATDWAVAFPGLASNATNYISLRAWDQAGSTTTVIDAFYVLKDTVPPTTTIAVPASAFRSSLATISGTAADQSGVQATELSIQQVSGSLYWNGGDFGSAAQIFFTAGGGTAWGLSAGIAWVNGFAYRIVARSSDVAGNYSVVYATADFTLDTSTPAAAVAVPATGSTIASLPVISGTAADAAPVDSGISAVEVRLRRNSDDLWWNWFTQAWGPTAVSSAAAGTSAWSLSPTPQLQAGLDNGTSYFIAVRAVDNAVPANSGDFFALGSTFTWQDVTPPSAVDDLAAVAGSLPGRINLTWTAPGDDGGLGLIGFGEYRIFYSTLAAAAASTSTALVIISTAGVNAGDPQSYTLTGLTPGVTYHVSLALADSDVNWSSFSNQASTTAAPALANAIAGHVVNVATQGITAVQVDCWNAADALVATTFTLADGSGTYTVNGLISDNYKIRVTWTANGFSSSLWQDGITMGASGVDFFLEINYALATLTGTLSTLTTSSFGGGGGLGVAAASESFVELHQQGREVARVSPQPTGRWTIAGLLPGKYSVRAFTGLGYTQFQEVELTEGDVKVLDFAFDNLPAASVYAFPNPARSATTIRFATALFPLQKQVLIFDLAGNQVREITDDKITGSLIYHADWDLNNSKGQAVAPGVYLFMVKIKGGIANQTATVIKKVAVVR